MPPVGMLIGKVDLSNMFLNLGDGTFTKLAEAKAAGVPTINYGLFLNTMIDFLIVAFAIFLLIRQVNRFKAEPAPAPAAPTTKDCPLCCTAIPIKASRCPACTSELKAA
jgi:large conductance mechanosensitive channel